MRAIYPSHSRTMLGIFTHHSLGVIEWRWQYVTAGRKTDRSLRSIPAAKFKLLAHYWSVAKLSRSTTILQTQAQQYSLLEKVSRKYWKSIILCSYTAVLHWHPMNKHTAFSSCSWMRMCITRGSKSKYFDKQNRILQNCSSLLVKLRSNLAWHNQKICKVQF